MNAKRKIQYWKMWETEVQNKVDMHDQRQDLFGKVEWGEDMPDLTQKFTLCQIAGKKRAAIKAYNQVLGEAADERRKFLEEKAEYWALGDDTKKARILKNILRSETTKALFAKLKEVRGATGVSPIQSISVPVDPTKPKGPWYTIHDQATMNKVLLERNSCHFGQATGTPFTDDSLRIPLGRHGEGGRQSIDDLSLHGQSKATIQLIEALKKDRLPEISSRVEATEVRKGFHKWREGTSTSPSGRDLSKYKALFAPPPPEAENLEANIGDEVAEVLATLMNLCSHYGLALDRWLMLFNTMLEKVIGLDRIDKVRVIHIMEADMNLLMGILFGRRLSQHAEKHGKISDY
jgi:hypothetical protein